MHEQIKISTKQGGVEVDARLFRHLFESSIVSDHPNYTASLKSGSMTLSCLIELCRAGNIAYSLFFGSYDVVAPVIDEETNRLFGGFGGQFGLSVRGKTFNLNVVRLLIKDVKMKQETIARFVKVGRHPHVKFLKNSTRSLEDQAAYIVEKLGLDMEFYRSHKNKRDALAYMIGVIENNNIFVSIENTGTNMPQNFKWAKGLTGVYIKHSKFPYLFINKEGLADPEGTPMRKVFTLVYLLCCLFKGSSKMVSLDQSIGEVDDLFELTEMILMPKTRIPRLPEYTIDEVDSIAGSLNVSSAAVLVRLGHLDYIDSKHAERLRAILSERYAMFFARQRAKLESQQKEFRHNKVNNIRIYQGKAYLRILKSQYIAGNIKRRELNKYLAYGTKGGVDIDGVFKGL